MCKKGNETEACCCCCLVASVVSVSVWPHRRQPSRLCHPWDSPGKNPGVGCHFLLQCMKVKSEGEVAQSCPTLRNPVDCRLPGFSVHGILQGRVEWVAIAFSGDWTLLGRKRMKRSRVKEVKLGRLVNVIRKTIDFIHVWQSATAVLWIGERHDLIYIIRGSHSIPLRIGFRYEDKDESKEIN